MFSSRYSEVRPCHVQDASQKLNSAAGSYRQGVKEVARAPGVPTGSAERELRSGLRAHGAGHFDRATIEQQSSWVRTRTSELFSLREQPNSENGREDCQGSEGLNFRTCRRPLPAGMNSALRRGSFRSRRPGMEATSWLLACQAWRPCSALGCGAALTRAEVSALVAGASASVLPRGTDPLIAHPLPSRERSPAQV